MKGLFLIVIVAVLASAPHAGMPLFSATCPGNINVDADRTGTVRLNGKKAAVKKINESYYEARRGKTTYSIAVDPGAPPTVTYTGKHGANGVCQVSSFKESGPGAEATGASSSERAGRGKFDATGQIPCAQSKGQPMGQCQFGVARDGNGSATVVVTRPDGRKRAIFFENGKAVGADLSQADGNMEFRSSKEADLFKIQAGDERYEIPDVVVLGD